MKLIVLIFAHNEEDTIKEVINEIPQNIDKIDEIEIVVMDDGSTDNTRIRAQEAGANVVSNIYNKGLAKLFMKSIEEALKRGANLIVHTDGDNQYNQKQITDLVQPILKKKTEVVIGNRQIKKLDFMKKGNKYGNLFGNFVFNKLLNLKNIDFSSGYRAYTKEAALNLTIFSNHTYTHESIIQLVNQGQKISSIPIDFRVRTNGESRLIKSLFSHISKSVLVILRTILYYKPLKTFSIIGGTLFLIGVLIGLRFLYFYFTNGSSGHIQSLILATILIIISFLMITMGFISDLINKNSQINHQILYEIRKEKYNKEK
jgi:glycosyltransferase involved in cell wall biosynthesis